MCDSDELYTEKGEWAFNDYDTEYEEEYFAENEEETIHEYSNLSDFVAAAFNQKSNPTTHKDTKDRLSQSSSSSEDIFSSNRKKNHIVYFEENVADSLIPEEESDVKEVINDTSFEIPEAFSVPVYVQLPSNELTPEYLLRACGATYEKSQSLPKRFSIDISDRVIATFSQRTVGSIRDLYWKADLTTYLIVEKKDNDANHADSSLFTDVL